MTRDVWRTAAFDYQSSPTKLEGTSTFAQDLEGHSGLRPIVEPDARNDERPVLEAWTSD